MQRDPRWLAWVIALAGVTACGDNLPDHELSDAAIDAVPADARPEGHIDVRVKGQPGRPRVLVYTYENYYRHYSNIDCMLQIYAMVNTRGFSVMSTNDPLAINATNLAEVDVVVFCLTSGSGINSLGQADFEAWIRAGGGVVGFHSASATESFWPFYIANLGTSFAGHPDGLFPATVSNLSTTHPITAGLPDLQMTDEWYIFSQRPETIPGAVMLLGLEEGTLPGDYPVFAKQGFHPIAWANERFGGRMFYSAFGHAQEAWSDPTVQEITGRAIEWAAHQR